MGIWKTLRQEKPDKFANVIILTKGNRITQAFYSADENKFYNRFGIVRPITYKRWCYEYELVQQALNEIKTDV